MQSRGVIRKIRSRLLEHGLHLFEDMVATGFGLDHRLAHDLAGYAFDLDIHLQSGNTVAGTGHFEVHVTEVVFGAGDIAENRQSRRHP